MPSQPASPARPSSNVPAALSVAICAALGASGTHAAPLLIDIPDITVTGTHGVDFNGDGISEFTFTRTHGGLGEFTFEGVSVDTGGNAVVESGAKGPTFAAALGGGETIDATRTFTSGSLYMAKFDPGFGEFVDPGLAYLGVRFTIPTDGAAHYGWVEVSTGEEQITLTRLFWDSGERVAATTPGGSVPEPGTLALMIAGAAGILALRRRKQRPGA